MYAALFPQLYLGYFNDDALYVVAAQSVLQGRYIRLYHPLLPPMNHPLPGYPVFLAPFLWIAQPHWAALKAINIVVTMLSCVLLWDLWSLSLDSWTCALAVALYALNPTTATYAATVMPEPCFLLLFLVALNVFRAYLAHPRHDSAWILGALLAWLALIRPEGILLAGIFGAVLLKLRHRSALARVLLPSLGLWASVLLRNYRLTRSPTNYVETWTATSLHIAGGFGRLAAQAARLLHTLLMNTILAVPWDTRSPFLWVVEGALLIILSALLISGFRKWLSNEKIAPMAWVIGSFCVLYFGVHAFWAVTERYFLPVLPFLFGMALMGGCRGHARNDCSKRLTLLAAAALCGLYLVQDARCIHMARSGSAPVEKRLPAETFAWIRAHTPPDAIFLAKAPVVYLYTGRQAVSAVRAENKEEFRGRLNRMDVTYALSQPRMLLSLEGIPEDPAAVWERSQKWLREWPEAFQPVYRNAQEGTVLFKIQ